MKVYFIPGIGADYRSFTHIRLPVSHEIAYVHYISPREDESLRDYAIRLSKQIDNTKPFALAGHSLGGIMAVEIANQLNPACTILINSIPVSSQLPRYYAMLWKLGVAKLAPVPFFKVAATIKHRLTLRSKADRRLMRPQPDPDPPADCQCHPTGYPYSIQSLGI